MFTKVLILLSILIQVFSQDDTLLVKELRTSLIDSNEDTFDAEGYEYNLNWINEISDTFLSQWIEIKILRKNCKNCKFLRPNKYKDFEYDLEKSEKTMKRYLQWRLRNNLDRILSWNSTEYMKTNFPLHMIGYNEQGNLVTYGQFGEKWPVRNALGFIKRKEIFKHVIQVLEKVHLLSNYRNKFENLAQDELETDAKSQSQSGQQGIVIADVKDFSLTQVTSIRVLGWISDLFNMFANYYPIIFGKIFLINMPGFFGVILDLLKSTVSAKALEGLEVFGADQEEKWLSQMEKVMPRSLIPKNIGGDADLNL